MNITNDLVTEYLNGYYKPLNNKLSDLREIGEKDNVPIILKETEFFLNTILKLKVPKKILEIGTAIGYSSAYFSAICPEADIWTIEKDEFCYKAALHNINALGLSKNIHIKLGDGQEQIEKLRDNEINGFDFVFIDAAKSHYKRFLDSSLDICNDKALIVSDNILQRAMTVSDQYDPHDKHRTNIRKMREYVDYICNCSYLDTSLFSIGDGIAVSIYKR